MRATFKMVGGLTLFVEDVEKRTHDQVELGARIGITGSKRGETHLSEATIRRVLSIDGGPWPHVEAIAGGSIGVEGNGRVFVVLPSGAGRWASAIQTRSAGPAPCIWYDLARALRACIGE